MGNCYSCDDLMGPDAGHICPECDDYVCDECWVSAHGKCVWCADPDDAENES